MFQTRMTFKVVNYRAGNFRYASAQRLEQMDYPISKGLRFELLPGVVTNELETATWDFEAKEFQGFARVWISGDDKAFDEALQLLRNDEFEVIEYVEEQYPCGHMRRVPIDPDQCEACMMKEKKREESITKLRRLRADPSMTTITLRIPKDVHVGLKDEAAWSGISLNQICIDAFNAELHRLRESRPTKQEVSDG